MNWRYRIELADLWKKFEAEEIDIEVICKKTAERIKKSLIPAFLRVELEPICDQLQHTDDVEDFDQIMEELYEFADQNKIWVETRILNPT